MADTKTPTENLVATPGKYPGLNAKRDKKVVIGEHFDRVQLESFLLVRPPVGYSADYYRMVRAYRSLPIEDFTRFLGVVQQAGKAVNPCDSRGETFLSSLEENHSQLEYAQALQAFLS